jgi:hypothetical protein
MALDFPSSPALNDTYTEAGKTWRWNGTGWQLVTAGTVTNADISATAEIAVSKLADGNARQLLQTDAAGTGVEWTSNVDVPGTLDVTGAAVFDSTVAVTGALTKGGSDVVTVGDTGTVTSTMIANSTIVDADISATAEIAVSKLADGAARQLLQTDAAGTGVEWTSNVDIPGTLDVTGATTLDSTLTVASNVTLNAQSDLRFADADSSNWVAFQAPATVSSNVTWTLPAADGTANQVLSTNGTGTLSWATGGGGATDKIEEGNSSAEVIDTGSDGRFVVTTEGSERLRCDSDGRLLVGTTTTSEFHILNRPSATEGNIVLYVGYALYGSALFFECNSGFYSENGTAIKVCKNTSTNRSINAGGTVNANGNDYAEYMAKSGDFTIDKGDICGIDPDGKLTTNFADSVSYVVKSTDPSYVGGDTWGTEDAIGAKPAEDEVEALAEWESALEAARQKVDRIAFAGQVPVNVTDAIPGQYIVPVATEAGGITGIAKDESDLTLAEYMRAVGKVIAIENDGRARIIVKVA